MGIPLVSVVVPVYNTAIYLRRCLDGLLSQTYPNIEVICVDDGSTDESAKILEQYAHLDSRVKIISQANNGLSAARNAALEVAKGEWVSFVDSDDYVKPQLYERLQEAFADEDVDVVWFGNEVLCSYDSDLKEKCEQYFTQNLSGKELCRPGIIGWKTFCVWGKLYRRSLLEKFAIRYPVGARYEDLCFNWKVFGVARAIWFVPEKLYCYELHESGIMNSGRRGDIEPAGEYWKLLSPAYEFYRKHGLLPKRRGMFFHFLLRLYSAAQHYSSVEYKAVFRRALISKAQKNKWVEMMPQHELWLRMLKDEFPLLAQPSQKCSFLGIPVWQRIVSENEVVYEIFGIPLVSHLYLYSCSVKTFSKAAIRKMHLPLPPPSTPGWQT